MNQAFHLYRLQQIDTQIAQVDAQIAEIDHHLASDELVSTAQSTLESIEKQHRKASQALRQIESEVREQNLKIEQSEATLYGGKVRNPKELQDLQKELASIKKHLAVLEDQQLEAMMASEDVENQEQAARTQVAQAQAAFAEVSAVWLGKREQLVKTRDRLLAERAPALSLISAQNMQTYDRLRKKKSGIAVTTVRDGSCAVCGAAIRPSEVQEARAAQDFIFCTSCGRNSVFWITMLRLPNIHVDRVSFWLGFLAASLFWWAFSHLRPLLPVFMARIRKTASSLNVRIWLALKIICAMKFYCVPNWLIWLRAYFHWTKS